ncbi:MAG: hypothetical protein WCH62_04395, partial [Candidatus Omnitrophota bacterium]
LGFVQLIKWVKKHFSFYSYFIPLFTIIVFIWFWNTRPSVLVLEEMDQFKEAAAFAESVSPGARFCSFGQEEDHFSYYSKQAVVKFVTFDEFKSFYENGHNIVCFGMPIHQMSLEHWKIFLVLLKNSHIKNFGQIQVFYLP